MATDIQSFDKIKNQLAPFSAQLIAVSKTKPVNDIRTLYDAGQHDFGENYVQELSEKQAELPADIRWHFIGHLQSNKVKYIAPFIHMIQSVDRAKLLREINKQAAKHNRVIDCLLQVHIAEEETKFGLDEQELYALLDEVITSPASFEQVRLRGLMGMATNTDDKNIIRKEFRHLSALSEAVRKKYGSKLPAFSELSMGMSSDYPIALEEGSTMVRIGSLLFGSRKPHL